MPRKKRANIRAILLKRIQEPEVAERIVSLLLTFPENPEKVKSADVLKLIEYATGGASGTAEAVEIPDADEDFSGYTDAQLWDWLRRLEGGPARGP